MRDGRPWTDPAPLVVRTTPRLTFPISHILLVMAACGLLAGGGAIAGESPVTSDGEGWASVATAVGLALVAVALPRLFKGELVVADDGIARRYRARPWQWAPAGDARRAYIVGGRRWTIDLAPALRGRGTRWSLIGWRLRQVAAALRAKGYDVTGP